MNKLAKQVVYVDVDDEITAVIDKISDADAKVVALVLPKRANVFQSVVNMKLLKRRAEQANKHLVLITSEAGLMPLAGMAGVYVAPTLQSKPEIPEAPGSNLQDDAAEEDAVSMNNDDFDNKKNGVVPVGTLAAAAGTLPEGVEEINSARPGSTSGKLTPEMAAAVAAGKAGADASPKGSKNKKLQVPDFLRFRKRLILAGLGLVALIALWYVAWFVVPTAQVTIKTKTEDINSSFELTLDTAATKVNTGDKVVPAKIEQQQKNQTQQAPATGQENKGNKATGEIRLTNCSSDNSAVTVPAGTGVSANGMTFLTQSSVNLPTSAPDKSGNCRDLGVITSANVTVVAQKAGAGYNLGATTFAVAGFGNVEAKSSSPLSGGTDNIVKVVQQSDIDAAKAKIANGSEKDTVSKALQKSLEDGGYYAIGNTMHIDAGDVVTSTKVGDEAEAVTVSQSLTYTMYGAKKADLRQLIEAEVDGKIDKSKQSIIDDGLGKAKFSLAQTASTPQLKINLIDTVVAGPKLNIDQVKQDMVGKKSGVVRDQIKTNPGVEDVNVKYSPFWVTKAPKPAKTTIVFEKVGTTQ